MYASLTGRPHGAVNVGRAPLHCNRAAGPRSSGGLIASNWQGRQTSRVLKGPSLVDKTFPNKGLENVVWQFEFPELHSAGPGMLRIKVTAEVIVLSHETVTSTSQVNRLVLRHGPEKFLTVDFSPLASSGFKWKDCAKYKEEVKGKLHHLFSSNPIEMYDKPSYSTTTCLSSGVQNTKNGFMKVSMMVVS